MVGGGRIPLEPGGTVGSLTVDGVLGIDDVAGSSCGGGGAGTAGGGEKPHT